MPSTRSHLWYAGAAVAVTVLYRVVVFAGFPNDHYMHLAWAQQMIRGEMPGRDFVGPGMPLTIGLSAAAQFLFGSGIRAEFALASTFLAAAAGLTCWLAMRVTGSVALGLVATALQVVVYPRSYNYPKVFVPVVAVLLLWRYVERPTVRRAAALGLWAATGFLFRHDYLLYLAVATVVALATVLLRAGWETSARHLGACVGAAALLLLPYVILLTFAGGVPVHVRDAVEFAKSEQYQWTLEWPRFAFSPAAVLPSLESLDPAGPLRRAARAVVLGTVSILAPTVNFSNAAVLMYYGAFALPGTLIVAIGAVLWRRDRWRPSARTAQLLTLAAFSLVLAFGLVRHPIEARVADLASTMPLVVVALVASMSRRATVFRIGAAALLAVAIVAVVVQGRVWNRLYDAGVIQAPTSVTSRVGTVFTTMDAWPWERFWPQGRMPEAVRYLNSCTAPDDRVLVTWFAPEMFVFAERGFAAGHAFFTGTHYLKPEDQRLMIERLGQQRVPVALVNVQERAWFSARFARVDAYLRERYIIVGTYRPSAGEDVAIAVDRDLTPLGTHAPTGWPCFRS